MSLLDALADYGDLATLSRLERLAGQIGQPFAGLPAKQLIREIFHREIPPPGPAPTPNEIIQAALDHGLDRLKDDEEDDEKDELFPLSLRRYLTRSKELLGHLMLELTEGLQTGRLQAFGLRHGDAAPVLIPRGNWFSAKLDWASDTVASLTGEPVFHLIKVRPLEILPRDYIPDTDYDAGAKTEPYLDEYRRLAQLGRWDGMRVSDIVRYLRTWGRNYANLPVSKTDSLRKRIDELRR